MDDRFGFYDAARTRLRYVVIGSGRMTAMVYAYTWDNAGKLVVRESPTRLAHVK